MLLIVVVLLERLGPADLHHSANFGWTCLFRHLTHVPCAFCGSTRATVALFTGDPVAAATYNPLATVLWIALAGWLSLRWLFPASPLAPIRLRRTRPIRLIAWVIAVTALIANWAYVIREGI